MAGRMEILDLLVLLQAKGGIHIGVLLLLPESFVYARGRVVLVIPFIAFALHSEFWFSFVLLVRVCIAWWSF